MKEVKALAVMTRPELEKALADVNVTRRLQHKLLELQQEQVRMLREALMECRRVLTIDNEYPLHSTSVQRIDAALAATEPRP